MAGRKRLYLYWDPAIEGGLRRRIEAAFARLNVETADGETVDADPENPGVVAAIASAAGGWAGPAKADIVIQAGPGPFPATSDAIRLTAADLAGDTPRWGKLVDQLRGRMGLPSLALPVDELEVRLNETSERADQAERNMSAALLNEANAVRESRKLQLDMAQARERIAELERENTRLRELNDSGRFAIGAVPESMREAVAQAREVARRAELAAAKAAEAAAAYPDQIAWSGALYSGETRNGRPHGYGVMIFLQGKTIIASYRGAFLDGRRAGLGVGAAEDGLVWSGQWAGDEACGSGVLEAPDGRRFEGNVKADGAGAPVPDAGWKWAVPGTSKRRPAHHVVAPSLPAPSPDQASASS